MSTWEAALEAHPDLQRFGDNAVGLFALALRFRIDDIESTAANCLTDGSDDKKCDLVFVDHDERVAVVAQCYWSKKKKASAPSSKAADLNTAIAWLIQRPLSELPQRIRPAATELREALRGGHLDELHFWYVHNLPESENVRAELATVESSASAALNSVFHTARVRVSARELGEHELEKMYGDTQTPILVTERVEFKIPAGFEIAATRWKSFVTTISARQLRALYRKHKTDLFSANVRDYLGARHSDANINNGIRQTAEAEPENFWAFNNGLTVLVNDYVPIPTNAPTSIAIMGLSIVNGAQTTGAIGTLKTAPDDAALVPVRFVKTSDPQIVQDIVQYNNSQNKVTASDFRSTDRIQKRLRSEMELIPNAEYQGGRRGGHAEVIARRPNLMPSYTVGQALAALHGDPAVAYNQKSEIWAADNLYAKYFNENTSASHLVFAYSLMRAIEFRKLSLLERERAKNDLKTTEAKELAFFRGRGANYLYAAAVGGGLETLLARKIPNRFRVSFGSRISPLAARMIWDPIVVSTASLTIHLIPALEAGMKAEALRSALETFSSLLETTTTFNDAIYSSFRAQVVVS